MFSLFEIFWRLKMCIRDVGSKKMHGSKPCIHAFEGINKLNEQIRKLNFCHQFQLIPLEFY